MSEKPPALILGCGYTGRRVAERLLARGFDLTVTTREPEQLASLAAAGVEVLPMEILDPESVQALAAHLCPGAIVLHSIPVTGTREAPLEATSILLDTLGEKPVRMVYLSTTGVYGRTVEVDETTAAAPISASGRLRIQAEELVRQGPWSSLILRPAAIYGPGRGVHESIRRGRYRLAGAGQNYVSRVHVDDLAAVTEVALLSELTGTYPVADREPCTSRQMAQFCADLLGVPLPPSAPAIGVHHTRRANRRVNGAAIFERLGVDLRFPSYRVGVPASL